MATLTASAAQSTVPAKAIHRGTVERVVSYTCNPALSAGDVIQMLRVPAGATILSLRFWTDLFGGGNATITGIGDGNSATRFMGSASTSNSLAASLFITPQAQGYSYSVEDTIDITIGTVTSASAVGTLSIFVAYTMDNQ